MNWHYPHIGKSSETSFLGSDVTVVLTKNDSGTMEELQQTHYYPFGGIIANSLKRNFGNGITQASRGTCPRDSLRKVFL